MTPVPPPWYKWAVVGMLWLVCLLNYADRQAVFSVFGPIQSEMGLSDIQLGVVGSAFMWVYAVALPFAGMVVDRVSRKALVLGGLFFWSVVTGLTALATNFEQLVLCRALEGFGEAFYFPASMSLVSDYHGRLTRSRAMAIHQSSVYAGTVLGGTLAGYCGEFHGWRTGFYIFGGAGVLLAAVLAVTLREPARGATDDLDPHARPATVPELMTGAFDLMTVYMVRLLLAGFVCTVFVGSIFLAWMPTYLSREFGLTLSKSGLNATIWLQVGSVVGVFVGGWWADLWVRTWPGGRLAVEAIGLVVGAPLLLVAGQATDVNGFLLLLAAFGFCKGLYDSNTWAALYDAVRPEQRGTALGLVNGLGWLMGGATAPIVYAYTSNQVGAGLTISALSVVYLLAAGLLLVGIVTLPRSRPESDHDRDPS